MAKGKQKAMVANKQKDNALEKRNAEAKVTEKLKASCIGKGKQKSTYANKGKENAPVDLHHHRNGVVIRDEMQILICEEKRRAKTIAMEKLKGTSMGKGKQEVAYANKGQDNSMVPNKNVILKATLAKCARRERERSLKQSTTIPSGQCLQVDHQQDGQCLQPTENMNSFSIASRWHPTCLEQGTVSTNVAEPAQKRQMVMHSSTCSTGQPSTSFAPQRNWSTPISQLFQEDLCCRVDIEDILIPMGSRVHTPIHINLANAFTSLGATWDDKVLSGRGPVLFTIHGELRHRTGSLLPQTGQDGIYAQLYIIDLGTALDVHRRRNPQLGRDVLQIIQRRLS
ncbi:hypothetical protein Vadar_021614 [Vaccinium darrowii]|uniref:Uncharacterized protein n=1 Tax=Vaccinium darrowii TaxID=229202 RepID=A0ACB7YXS7_9ERIC|nr:hypothetical protein Vadar_021614 [Vaccinium darrowii]